MIGIECYHLDNLLKEGGLLILNCSYDMIVYVFMHLALLICWWVKYESSFLLHFLMISSIYSLFCDRMSCCQWCNLKIWLFLFHRKAPLRKNWKEKVLQMPLLYWWVFLSPSFHKRFFCWSNFHNISELIYNELLIV